MCVCTCVCTHMRICTCIRGGKTEVKWWGGKSCSLWAAVFLTEVDDSAGTLAMQEPQGQAELGTEAPAGEHTSFQPVPGKIGKGPASLVAFSREAFVPVTFAP